MPELSRFHGIVIRMYAEIGGRHHAPHFHAYHQGEVAIYTVDPLVLIAGRIPRVQRHLVETWAEIHRDELLADWQRLQEGLQPLPIEPLR